MSYLVKFKNRDYFFFTGNQLTNKFLNSHFSGNEYTQVFGSNAFEGTLTPFIADSFLSGVDKCILDGEMLGYHAETDSFGQWFIHGDK